MKSIVFGFVALIAVSNAFGINGPKVMKPLIDATPSTGNYDDGTTKIHWEVVHSAVFSLDAQDHISAVSCQGTTMKIETSNNYELVIPKNTTLVGSAKWKCEDENGRLGFPLYRNLVTISAPVKTSGDHFVYTLQTAYAGVADCFEDGSFMNMSTSAMNVPYPINSTQATVSKSFGFNYDEKSGKAVNNIPLWSPSKDEHLDCTNCFIEFTLGMSVHVSIGRKDIVIPYLKSFSTGVSGSFKHNVDLELSASASKTASDSKVIATIKLPGFTFFIGIVPVYIALSVPITVGFSLSASAAASLTAGYDIEGGVGMGIQYSDGKWGPANSHSFGEHLHKPTLTKRASASAEIFLEPSINMEFYGVGGGQFNLKPSVTGTLAYPGGCSSTQAKFGLNYNIAGSVDAILTRPVHLTSPAFNVFSLGAPLVSECL